MQNFAREQDYLYSSSAIVHAVRVSKSNARSTSQEANSGILINGVGMMMAAMGMQYNTHEIQQQLVLLQGHELCLDDSERAFFHYKDPCHVNCGMNYLVTHVATFPALVATSILAAQLQS